MADRNDKLSGGRDSRDSAENASELDQEASAAAELEQLRSDLDATRDRMLRASAELDNYRKRAARELESERRFANLPLLRDLLPVFDNVQRAIEAGAKTEDNTGLLAGFRLVLQQLEAIFARHHCTPIEALGKPFDPHVHEAISQVPSADYPPGTVVAVATAGYQLHDRVLRPAQVIVSAADE